jgi:UDP-N-acetyl-D-galactosamine dehydrogenase
MVHKDIPVKGSKALILGFTFKENCPDIRNTRVIDIYHYLNEFGLNVSIYDPWAKKEEILREHEIFVCNEHEMIMEKYSVIILAVNHDVFRGIDYSSLRHEKSIIYDIKGFLDDHIPDFKL